MLNQLMIRQVRERMQANDLPVSIELWNGEHVLPALAPRVLVRLHKPSSLKALVKPSLGTLARAYVEGELDLEGDIRDILSMGDSFCHASDCQNTLAPRSTHWWRARKPMRARIFNTITMYPMIFMRCGLTHVACIRALILKMPTCRSTLRRSPSWIISAAN